MNKREKSIPGATALMASLVRQKPKPHEEMKLGKKPAKSKKDGEQQAKVRDRE